MLPFGKPEGLIILSLNELSLFFPLQSYKHFLNLARENQVFFSNFPHFFVLPILWKSHGRQRYDIFILILQCY